MCLNTVTVTCVGCYHLLLKIPLSFLLFRLSLYLLAAIIEGNIWRVYLLYGGLLDFKSSRPKNVFLHQPALEPLPAYHF